ncbi:MAG: trigger factor [Succinivibrio sp.]|nr:trigger factor [Succinivibrio sp.]
MQVSTETKEGLKRRITVTVPAAEAQKAYAQSFKKYTSKARIDGFRKGHVPANIVEMHFGMDILTDSYDSLIRSTIDEAIKQSGLDVAGTPTVDLDKNDGKDKDFTYFLDVEAQPAIEVKPLEELKIKRIKSDLTDADVDKMIETLRKQQRKWKNVDGLEFGAGTMAKIDFTGRADGKEFEGGKASDFAIEADNDRMIPGFTDQIKGHKAGDKFTIKVTFPAEYQAKELAGKEAEFDITVNSVAQEELPEVNADFAKLYGVKSGDLEELKKELRNNMQRELDRALENRNTDNVIDALLKQYGDFQVTEAGVKAQIQYLKNVQAENLRRYGMKELPERLQKDELYRDDAVKHERASLLFRAIAKDAKLEKASDEYITRIIDAAASAYDEPEEFKKEIRKDKRSMENVAASAWQNQLVDYILSKGSDGETSMTFDELVGTR